MLSPPYLCSNISLRRMPAMLSFASVLLVHAVAVACLSCLLLRLKNSLYYECSDSFMSPTVVMCTVAAACFLVASGAFFFKSRAWTRAAAMCCQWQPLYFLFVSVQRLILRAIVTSDGTTLPSCATYKNQIWQAELLYPL